MSNSLFIGRFQPFHEGHRKLIEVELRAGRAVVIAVRDTGLDGDNPYTFAERKKMVLQALADWGDRVQVILIPDVARVCYGRDVGYEIVNIQLDQETEAISATSIRGASSCSAAAACQT